MIITMTAWKRPEYTNQVLRALEDCDGSEDVKLYAHVEPGNDDVQSLLIGSRLLKDLTVNPSRLGIPKNTYNALQHGFKHSDYVIHMEDDTLPAKDFLSYHKWAAEQYKYDESVFNITGYHRIDVNTQDEADAALKENPKLFHTAKRRSWFTCWGWGTWADRWEEIAEYWSNDNPGFAWHVNLGIRLNRVEIHPLLSRVQNIGEEGGAHEGAGLDDKLDIWAADYDIPEGEFSE